MTKTPDKPDEYRAAFRACIPGKKCSIMEVTDITEERLEDRLAYLRRAFRAAKTSTIYYYPRTPDYATHAPVSHNVIL